MKQWLITGLLLGALTLPLPAVEPAPGTLRTINDYLTGQPLTAAVADGTVYEFRATVPKVNFWKTPAPLDGLWIESTDKKTLLWLSSTSGADATTSAPCPSTPATTTSQSSGVTMLCLNNQPPPNGCVCPPGQTCCPGTANCYDPNTQICCDGTPTAAPTVTISGTSKCVFLCSGASPTIQLTANGQPSGGSYVWAITVGGAKIATDSGLQSATVTLHGTIPSDTRNDVSLTVTYTKCGTTVNATQTLTVQQPYSVSVLGSSTVPISSGGTNGYGTAYLFQVQDHLVPRENIQAVMHVDEYRILKCTTDDIPVKSNGKNTDTLGRFADLLGVSFPGPIPTDFQAQVDQTITVGTCFLDASGTRCQHYGMNSAQSVQGICPGGCQ